MGDWRNWLHGLVGAVIGSAASVASGFAVGISWQKLGQQALVSAVVGAGLYLTKSPIWSTTTTATLTQTPGSSTLEVKKEESKP
jgi:uncharacterized membrane protein YeaQ/YmgE (transglycosylase-associated protein family)